MTSAGPASAPSNPPCTMTCVVCLTRILCVRGGARLHARSPVAPRHSPASPSPGPMKPRKDDAAFRQSPPDRGRGGCQTLDVSFPWALQKSRGSDYAFTWKSVAFGNNRFVAVASSASGGVACWTQRNPLCAGACSVGCLSFILLLLARYVISRPDGPFCRTTHPSIRHTSSFFCKR